ncbi:MAG TPA: hypothetical protein VN898_15475 [Candidatus Binatia bacterium]|nr:hypothetical protein [Candidatus Binatia bacterium]
MMRRTPRTALVAICFVCLLVLPSFQSAHRGGPVVSPAASSRHATVEPGLPLRIDLSLQEDRTGHGNPASLDAVIDAADDLSEVSLRWIFPEGVQQGAAEDPSQSFKHLRAGERRLLRATLKAARQADFPIRLEASFQVPDGRTFRTQQGLLWRRGARKPDGLHHVGAFEVMGEPVAEPLP